VSYISVSNASIFTPNARLFQTTPDVSGFLTVFYGTAASEIQEPTLTDIPYLSIGTFSPSLASGSRFCATGQDCSPYMHTSGTIRGLFMTLPGAGSYSMVAEGPLTGWIAPTQYPDPFNVSSTGSFVSIAYFLPPTPVPTPTPTPSDAFLESCSFDVSHRHLWSPEFRESGVWTPSAELGQSQAFVESCSFDVSHRHVGSPEFRESGVWMPSAELGQSQAFVESCSFDVSQDRKS
jgi:hypothetical protein